MLEMTIKNFNTEAANNPWWRVDCFSKKRYLKWRLQLRFARIISINDITIYFYLRFSEYYEYLYSFHLFGFVLTLKKTQRNFNIVCILGDTCMCIWVIYCIFVRRSCILLMKYILYNNCCVHYLFSI